MDNEFSVNEFGFNESKLTQNLTTKGDPVMRILALGLGKYKSTKAGLYGAGGSGNVDLIVGCPTLVLP